MMKNLYLLPFLSLVTTDAKVYVRIDIPNGRPKEGAFCYDKEKHRLLKTLAKGMKQQQDDNNDLSYCNKTCLPADIKFCRYLMEGCANENEQYGPRYHHNTKQGEKNGNKNSSNNQNDNKKTTFIAAASASLKVDNVNKVVTTTNNNPTDADDGTFGNTSTNPIDNDDDDSHVFGYASVDGSQMVTTISQPSDENNYDTTSTMNDSANDDDSRAYGYTFVDDSTDIDKNNGKNGYKVNALTSASASLKINNDNEVSTTTNSNPTTTEEDGTFGNTSTGTTNNDVDDSHVFGYASTDGSDTLIISQPMEQSINNVADGDSHIFGYTSVDGSVLNNNDTPNTDSSPGSVKIGNIKYNTDTVGYAVVDSSSNNNNRRHNLRGRRLQQNLIMTQQLSNEEEKECAILIEKFTSYMLDDLAGDVTDSCEVLIKQKMRLTCFVY